MHIRQLHLSGGCTAGANLIEDIIASTPITTTPATTTTSTTDLECDSDGMLIDKAKRFMQDMNRVFNGSLVYYGGGYVSDVDARCV